MKLQNKSYINDKEYFNNTAIALWLIKKLIRLIVCFYPPNFTMAFYNGHEVVIQN